MNWNVDFFFAISMFMLTHATTSRSGVALCCFMPFEIRAVAILLPVKLRSCFVIVPGFIHRSSIIDTTVDDSIHY